VVLTGLLCLCAQPQAIVRGESGPCCPDVRSAGYSLIIQFNLVGSLRFIEISNINRKQSELAQSTDEAMLKTSHTAPWLTGYPVSSERYPTMLIKRLATERATPLNLVIVLGKAFGATFVGIARRRLGYAPAGGR